MRKWDIHWKFEKITLSKKGCYNTEQMFGCAEVGFWLVNLRGVGIRGEGKFEEF
jgi:hypothetical protein